MNLRHFIPALVLLASQVVLSAQNPSSQDGGSGSATGADESHSAPSPALTGVVGIDSDIQEEDSSGRLPQIPALLGGPNLSVALRSETARSNYLRGGINVGGTFDDNTLLAPHNELNNTTYSVFPNISLEQVRSRASWKFGYAAGLTVNQRLSSRNQGSHDLNFDLQLRLSPHVNLRVAEDFSMTSGAFNAVNGAGAGDGLPNTSVLTPLAQQRSNSTVAEINYHFALNDIVGASGSFTDLHYDEVPAGAITLNNTRAASGSLFWLHGLGRDWLGVDYSFQRVTFDASGTNAGGESRVHSVLAVNTINLPNRFTITGFLGPEYSDNQGLVAGGSTPVDFHNWSFSGGGEVGWQKDHTSIAAGYSRRIKDGGGVLGVVRLQGVHGQVRQQLGPGWVVSAGASYGNNASLTVPSASSANKINTASAGFAFERNLGRSLGLQVSYAHDFQEQLGIAETSMQGATHRNRVAVTLGYQWSRPLGR